MKNFTQKISLSFIMIMMVVFSITQLGIAQNYQTFNASGTNALTAAVWSAASPTNACATPATSTFTSGSIAYFCTPSGTGSGATGISVGGIIATESYTHSSASGTFSTGGTVATVDVAADKVFDLSNGSFSTAAGTGFIKNGSGAIAWGGGTYAGGFTLNNGIMICRGVNAMGGAIGNSLTINGGTIAANANRSFTNKFPAGININANFTLGSSILPAVANSNLIFDNTMNLGGSNRTITIGGTGTYSLNGIMSNGDLTVAATDIGILSLAGANTISSLTVNGITGTVVRLNNTSGTTLPTTANAIVNSGRLAFNESQTLNNLTVASGAEIFVATGKTLTVTGALTIEGGALVAGTGTIAYTGAGKLVYTSGTIAQTTAIEWPATNTAEVEINNTNGVTLNKAITQNGVLRLTSGNLSLATFNLTISTSGSTIGGTATSYIATNGTGKLVREDIGGTAVSFPIGTATNFHPVTIANSGADAGTEDFGVNVAQQTPAYGDPTENVDLVFDISESTAGSANCAITMQFSNAASQGGAFSSLGAKIAHVNAGAVDYVNGTSDGTTVSGTGFTNFSPFFVTSDAEILPVKIISFTAAKRNNTVNVNWAVANEVNIANYVVEKSNDGITFSAVKNISAINTPNYAAIDETPFAGTNYYRLRIVEKTGTFTYSAIARVEFDGKSTGIKVFPTVTNNSFTINTNTVKVKNYAVINAQGKIMLQGRMTATQNVNVASLPSGTYQVKVDAQNFMIIKN